MNRRLILIVVGLALVLAGAGAGVWGWRGSRRSSVGSTPTDTARLAGAASDSTTARSVGPDSGRLSAADTAELRPPHPADMIGTWYHGDNRSRYGDSLVIVLNANGTATAHERRYILDKTGWHVARVEREGSWAMRYRGSNRRDLCTRWSKPATADACARVSLLADTLTGPESTMDFAGRHWRKAAPPQPAPQREGRPPGRGSGKG